MTRKRDGNKNEVPAPQRHAEATSGDGPAASTVGDFSPIYINSEPPKPKPLWAERSGAPQLQPFPGVVTGRLVCTSRVDDALPPINNPETRWVVGDADTDWIGATRQNVPPGAAYQKFACSEPTPIVATEPESPAVFEVRFNWDNEKCYARWCWPLHRHEKGHWQLQSHLGSGVMSPGKTWSD